MTVTHAWDKAVMVISVDHCGTGRRRYPEPMGAALSMLYAFFADPFSGVQITLQHADSF